MAADFTKKGLRIMQHMVPDDVQVDDDHINFFIRNTEWVAIEVPMPSLFTQLIQDELRRQSGR